MWGAIIGKKCCDGIAVMNDQHEPCASCLWAAAATCSCSAAAPPAAECCGSAAAQCPSSFVVMAAVIVAVPLFTHVCFRFVLQISDIAASRGGKREGKLVWDRVKRKTTRGKTTGKGEEEERMKEQSRKYSTAPVCCCSRCRGQPCFYFHVPGLWLVPRCG